MAESPVVVPLRTNSSAPVVTKLENRLRLFPPSNDCRKLGNPYDHSPVRWLASGGGVVARGVVPSFGVSVRFDASRACSPGPAAKSVVSCNLQSLSVFNVKMWDKDMVIEEHVWEDSVALCRQINWRVRVTLEVAPSCGGRGPSVE